MSPVSENDAGPSGLDRRAQKGELLPLPIRLGQAVRRLRQQGHRGGGRRDADLGLLHAQARRAASGVTCPTPGWCFWLVPYQLRGPPNIWVGSATRAILAARTDFHTRRLSTGTARQTGLLAKLANGPGQVENFDPSIGTWLRIVRLCYPIFTLAHPDR